MESIDKGYVYHICRNRDLTNFTKGYIGVAKEPTKRWGEHRRGKTNQHLINALRKHADVEFYVIFYGNLEHCYQLEEELRPEENMGWNINKGGSQPPNPKGKPHCISNLPPDKRRKGYKHSEETLIKIRKFQQSNKEHLSKIRRGSGNPNYGKTGSDNPNYKGMYFTPKGVFQSAQEAAEANNVSRHTVQKRCKGGSTVLRCREVPKSYLGKSWEELGWKFVKK